MGSITNINNITNTRNTTETKSITEMANITNLSNAVFGDYVLKAAPPEYIRQAVRTAAGGESVLSSGNCFETCLVA
jgi:DNA-binding NarL/FixJ family response regulator